MASVGDRMTFMGRLMNTMDEAFEHIFFRSLFNNEINVFRKTFGPHFKDYWVNYS